MALNNSSSKQQFSFSKSNRFPVLKSLTMNASSQSFDKTSDFNRTQKFSNSNSFAFGANDRRFDYGNTIAKYAKLPSPASYTTQPKTFSPEVSRNKGWSMSVGRDVTKKIHIDLV